MPTSALPYGLKWRLTVFGLEPEWDVEPDIAAMALIARRHFGIDQDATCTVEHIGQGSFNKVYKITLPHGQLVCMRVALPVDSLKTSSEVATMRFLRRETSVPVPEIYDYDATGINELRLPYLLMEFVEGKTLGDRWPYMTMTEKTALIKDLALYQAEMFGKQFDAIGCLQEADSSIKTPACKPLGWAGDMLHVMILVPIFLYLIACQIGRVGSDMPPIEAKNLVKVGPYPDPKRYLRSDSMPHEAHGPHRRALDWLHGRLLLADEALDWQTDEDDLKDAVFIKEESAAMRASLSEFFPANPEPTTLFHFDMHDSNIIIGDDNRVRAILDWKFVAVVPLWHACRLPKLFNVDLDWPGPPDEEHYIQFGRRGDGDDGEGVWIKGAPIKYWEHLAEYELSLLLPIFLSEMGRLQPEWLRLYNLGGPRVEFEELVLHVERAYGPSFDEWLEAQKAELSSIDETTDGDRTLVDDGDSQLNAKLVEA